MNEADLSAPVSAWMIAQGYTPYAEVFFPHCNRMIDLVGRNNARSLIVIELKRSLTQGVIHQAYAADLITNQNYAAVGTTPTRKGIEECAKLGIGLLKVQAGRVEPILTPSEKLLRVDWARTNYENEMHKNLDVHTPHGIGGLPARKGEGPAQDCYDRIALWREKNQRAKWKDIYREVPHHYCSLASLRSAMRIVEERRLKAARKLLQSATKVTL